MTRQVLPTTFPDGGWSRFVEENWESRAVVFRSIVPVPALSRAEFEAAVSAARNETGAVTTPWQFISSRNADPRSPRLYPKRADGGFAAYLARGARETRSRDVTFILNDAQVHSGTLFESCVNFLSGLSPLVGTPLESDAVVFASRSRVSAFGIHRDVYSNFLFVAEGEKTFYLWPRDAVRGNPKEVPVEQLPVLRASAERVDLEAGDMLYMPSGWYHCAVQDGFSVHLNIILSARDPQVTQRFLWRELEYSLRQSFHAPESKSFLTNPGEMVLSELPDSIATPLHRGLAVTRSAEEMVRTAFLRVQSASGFPRVPLERPQAPLKASDWVMGRQSNLHVMPMGSEMIVAACGQVYSLPAHPLLLEMLRTLFTGEPVQVRRLLRQFKGTAQVGDGEVSLTAQWISMFLQNLCQARWLNVVSHPKTRPS